MNAAQTLRRVANVAALTGATVVGAASAHLLVLLLAAIRGRGQESPSAASGIRFAAVVPAHDEEQQITRTVRSIRASAYPADRLRVIVVADNCADRTAAVAGAEGVEVWERLDPAHRGKGYALQWAFERLLHEPAIDAACVIDADCEVSPELFSVLAARLAAGAEAVQAAYLISNPCDSPAAALRWAGFALFNLVRPLGRSRMGLSSGLLGTGMAFSRRLLLRSPWQAVSYAEDREQHMRWVLAGARVEFAPEARVVSPAPSSVAAGKSQTVRWDSGRADLARRLTPKLLARWLRTGDSAALDAALEPLLPPQSVLLAMNLATLVATPVARSRALTVLATAAALGQVTYVVGGLAAVEAPPAVWRALLTVPRFVFRRLGGLSGSVVRGGPSGWERTQREITFATSPESEPRSASEGRAPAAR